MTKKNCFVYKLNDKQAPVTPPHNFEPINIKAAGHVIERP